MKKFLDKFKPHLLKFRERIAESLRSLPTRAQWKALAAIAVQNVKIRSKALGQKFVRSFESVPWKKPLSKDFWRDITTQVRDPRSRAKIIKDLAAQMEPSRLISTTSLFFRGKDKRAAMQVIAILLVSFFLADLPEIFLERYLPDTTPKKVQRPVTLLPKKKTLQDYDRIIARNLFNSRGIIPGEEKQEDNVDRPPVPTTLPFNLIGTIILRDEFKSIATIEDKSAQIVYPVRKDDEIPSKAKILEVLPKRVVFMNIQARQKEYVEIPAEAASTVNPISLQGGSASNFGTVEGVAEATTNVNIPRAEVDKALQDFNNVLTQARAVPHFENGQPAGYKLFQIVPGSIYQKLGLKDGDNLKAFNGEAMNDPGKAFAMLNELKSGGMKSLELSVVRDGKPMSFNYEIQ